MVGHDVAESSNVRSEKEGAGRLALEEAVTKAVSEGRNSPGLGN